MNPAGVAAVPGSKLTKMVLKSGARPAVAVGNGMLKGLGMNIRLYLHGQILVLAGESNGGAYLFIAGGGVLGVGTVVYLTVLYLREMRDLKKELREYKPLSGGYGGRGYCTYTIGDLPG